MLGWVAVRRLFRLIRFIEGFAPVGGWVGDPPNHVLGFLEFLRAYEDQLCRRRAVWTELASDFPPLRPGRWMRNDDQQIHIAALVRSSIGIGAEEHHFARMKALNQVLDKLLKFRRVSGWRGTIHYASTCWGSQSVWRPGTLYS